MPVSVSASDSYRLVPGDGDLFVHAGDGLVLSVLKDEDGHPDLLLLLRGQGVEARVFFEVVEPQSAVVPGQVQEELHLHCCFKVTILTFGIYYQ